MFNGITDNPSKLLKFEESNWYASFGTKSDSAGSCYINQFLYNKIHRLWKMIAVNSKSASEIFY